MARNAEGTHSFGGAWSTAWNRRKAAVPCSAEVAERSAGLNAMSFLPRRNEMAICPRSQPWRPTKDAASRRLFAKFVRERSQSKRRDRCPDQNMLYCAFAWYHTFTNNNFEKQKRKKRSNITIGTCSMFYISYIILFYFILIFI